MTAKRILLVGGAGVFGSRLARGLIATCSAQVLIAGRNLARGQALARLIGASGAVALDRAKASVGEICSHAPSLVIDAAGPFQGADLSFAKACIGAGVDYLDLADARDFVAAFPTLDQAARANHVRAITGASSTPALTHAALHELTRGWRRIDSIQAGVSPGNRAPRGQSVVKAILSWVGAPLPVFQGGVWRAAPGWSGTRWCVLPELGRRRFALAETPDLDLIPSRFGPTEDAVFLAGLELGLLHRGVGLAGAARRAGLVGDLRPLATPLRWLASCFNAFGSDRGCMFVEAFGRDADDRPVRAEWTLVSPPVEGPFTPTLPALAMARKLLGDDELAPGARACVGMVELEDLRLDFERHDLRTSITREVLTGPFEMALGPTFEDLPMVVRASHRQGPVARFEGAARVEGASPAAWVAARMFGFPRQSSAARVEVKKRILAPGVEVWERRIGGSRFRSEIRFAAPGRVTERFGPFTFTLALRADSAGLAISIKGWRIGPIGLPSSLAPRSAACEARGDDGQFTFDVPIAAPLLGRLTRYKGELGHTNIAERPT